MQVAKTNVSPASRSSRRPHRQLWGRQIAETDLAYQWSQHLSPVYGINLVGIRGTVSYLVRTWTQWLNICECIHA